MSNFKDRVRKVDVEKLSIPDADRIGVELGTKAGKILSKAEENINKIFEVYGVKVQVAVKLINLKTGESSEPVTFNEE